MICGAWLLLSIATGKVQFTDADEFSVILAKISDGQLMNTGGERSAMQHMRKFNPLNTFTSDDLNQSTFCQAHGLKVDRIYLSTLYCFISVLLQTDEKAKEMTYLCTAKQKIHFGSNFRSSHIATRLHLHYSGIRVCIPNNK